MAMRVQRLERVLDLSLAILALVVLSPLLGLIALAVRLRPGKPSTIMRILHRERCPGCLEDSTVQWVMFGLPSVVARRRVYG
jgi:ABC-type Fe3+ transport system permease subunit